EEAETAGDCPEVRPVESLGLRRGRAGVVDPARGKDAGAVPHTVAQIEIAEAGEVAGAAIAVARADEVASGVEARVSRRHADAVEELALHEGAHARLVRAEGLAHQARE